MDKKFWPSLGIVVFFVLVWFVAASILLDFWPLVRTEGEWATITNTQYGFSVDYPTKWKAKTYGENGFKGEDIIKLRIYRSAIGYFEIGVRYRRAANPTVEDVLAWGDARIKQLNRNVPKVDLPPLKDTSLSKDILSGQPVTRRRYGNEVIMNEDVYIARANDMIIITLQSETGDFENYLEDFNAIVASFRSVD